MFYLRLSSDLTCSNYNKFLDSFLINNLSAIPSTAPPGFQSMMRLLASRWGTVLSSTPPTPEQLDELAPPQLDGIHLDTFPMLGYWRPSVILVGDTHTHKRTAWPLPFLAWRQSSKHLHQALGHLRHRVALINSADHEPLNLKLAVLDAPAVALGRVAQERLRAIGIQAPVVNHPSYEARFNRQVVLQYSHQLDVVIQEAISVKSSLHRSS